MEPQISDYQDPISNLVTKAIQDNLKRQSTNYRGCTICDGWLELTDRDGKYNEVMLFECLTCGNRYTEVDQRDINYEEDR